MAPVTRALSPRLAAVVEALPLRPGLRVLEVGGAPGAAARAVAALVGPDGHVLVVDRSARGVDQVRAGCRDEIAAGVLSVRQAHVEEVVLAAGEPPYDLAFACRVGVLDGRHPAGFAAAVQHLRGMLVPGGPIFVDTGDPLQVLPD